MNPIKRLRRWDGVSAMLALASALLLIVSAWAIARPAPAVVPARILDRIRGGIEGWANVRDVYPNCDELNAAQGMHLPPGGPQWVAFDKCTAVGTPCLLCAQIGNFDTVQQPNQRIDINQFNSWSCNPDVGYGLVGECALVGAELLCNGGAPSNCSLFVIKSPPQQ